MKKIVSISFLIFTLSTQISAISLVYNMKIRRVFTFTAALNQGKKSRLLSTALPIVYKRKRHIILPANNLDICEKRLTRGMLFNFRYIYDRRLWAELTMGIEKEQFSTRGTQNICAAKSGFDDIVFSAGHYFFPTDNIQVVVYTIAGFPTRQKVSLLESQDTFVGTRFFSIGGGAEFSYSLINSLKRSLIIIYQNRFIHFFNRKWTPILPADAQLQPGNLIDLLSAVQFREKKNLFEGGFNATYFTNQAVVLKTEEIKSKNFLRSSFYGTYGRLFKTFPGMKIPGMLGTGFSVAYAPKKFNTKIFSYWFNFSLLF